MREIFHGDTLLHALPDGSRGDVVEFEGAAWYRIENYDAMPPFFMTVVSAYDHWMFVSSTGGLTCGRREPGNALFPYTTDDKVHDAAATTGPLTCLLVDDGTRVRLWHPFRSETRAYRLTRNLYKSREGNRLMFEEVNHDLGLVFSYAWSSGETHGFIREARLFNSGDTALDVRLLDGFRNLLPAGVEQTLQNRKSTLVDAYKRAESVPGLTAALFSLSSIVTDRAEPSEALRATVAWSIGLEHPDVLLSEDQVQAFCLGQTPVPEPSARGKRCAFLLHDHWRIPGGSERRWFIGADLDLGPVATPALLRALRSEVDPASLRADIERGTQRLRKLVGSADGFQEGADPLVAGRHFSNSLFNIMRGGVFDRGYAIPVEDLMRFVEAWNRPVADRMRTLLPESVERILLVELVERIEADGDPDLRRLVREYLPLTFSRRHGDPSRPWNHFSIDVRNPDGTNCLSYQGNWRDIFQNWEALAWSYPGFVESFIAKFVNATTADGYNAYRISRDGIEWEVLDPADPWSHIGYWGDHQLGYLLPLLELSLRYHPGRLEAWLSEDMFVFADVPYRLRAYADLLRDPRNTLDYDQERAQKIARRVKAVGADGKLVVGANDEVLRVNLLEKLLTPALAKLGNLVPGGGVWMNTQRPEWNDANNALVGYGVSVVTLCHLRRYIGVLEQLLSGVSDATYRVTEELAEAFGLMRRVLEKGRESLQHDMSVRERRQFMDAAGQAMDTWRGRIYRGFSGRREQLDAGEVSDFLALARTWIDHSLGLNRRPDGLFHAYNLLRLSGDQVDIDRLDVMLEGQVAVLSSGFLDPRERLRLLQALRASPLYREDKDSYLLYPDRQLAGFLEQNRLPDSVVGDAANQARLSLAEAGGFLLRDGDGAWHFPSRFRNAVVLSEELALAASVDAGTADWLLQLYEQVFRHRYFTGRSGSMVKYEGLGCIYWHMVSKLVLASAESAVEAHETDADPAVVDGLADCYREIREGLGLHKGPAAYGAFTTDPYSHTPGFAGVQQPGLTGQVKEDVIARFVQLGVLVERGVVRFCPQLLEDDEFLQADRRWDFVTNGERQSIDLPGGSLGFTLCGVPIVYRRGEAAGLEIIDSEGKPHAGNGASLGRSWSQSLFARDGRIARILVDVPADSLR